MASGTDLPFILTNVFTSKVNYSRRLEEFVCMNVSVMGGDSSRKSLIPTEENHSR